MTSTANRVEAEPADGPPADEPVDSEAVGGEWTAASLADALEAAIGQAWREITARYQSERDPLAFSMSALGSCRRQSAYRLAGTPPSEPVPGRDGDHGVDHDENRAANIGTMIHNELLPVLARLLGAEHEVDLAAALDELRVEGRSDLYVESMRLVLDLKTAGTDKWRALVDVLRAHRLQVGGYALGLAQAGKDVDWVAWAYLDRSSGQVFVVVEPFPGELLDLVEARAAELVTYARDPEGAPRDEHGPGLSVICDGCLWLRTCWGEDARAGEVGAQRNLVHDNAEVAEALDQYKRATKDESDAAARKEFYKAMFSGFAPGSYGTWAFSFSKAKPVADKDAAVELLVAAGLDVPMKPGVKRLSVRRAPKQM